MGVWLCAQRRASSPFCFFSVDGPACSLPGRRVGCACCPGALPEFGGHRGRRIVCQNRVNMLGCAANYTYVHDPQFTFHGNYNCKWASRSMPSQYATRERITVQTSCKLNQRLTCSIRVACSYDWHSISCVSCSTRQRTSSKRDKLGNCCILRHTHRSIRVDVHTHTHTYNVHTHTYVHTYVRTYEPVDPAVQSDRIHGWPHVPEIPKLDGHEERTCNGSITPYTL